VDRSVDQKIATGSFGSQADILRDELVEAEVHLATVRVAEPPAVPCQVEDVSYSGFLPEADL
jgi:hypothetical protein